MCFMILNYLDKKSMYIGLNKTPNKVLPCLGSRCCPVKIITRESRPYPRNERPNTRDLSSI